MRVEPIMHIRSLKNPPRRTMVIWNFNTVTMRDSITKGTIEVDVENWWDKYCDNEEKGIIA